MSLSIALFVTDYRKMINELSQHLLELFMQIEAMTMQCSKSSVDMHLCGEYLVNGLK